MQDLVRRSKREAELDLEKQEKRRRFDEICLAGMVTRSKVLQLPLMGGFLARELGNVDPESRTIAWARGLHCKGRVYFRDPSNYHNEIGKLWVATQDTTSGLAVAYACTSCSLSGRHKGHEELTSICHQQSRAN